MAAQSHSRQTPPGTWGERPNSGQSGGSDLGAIESNGLFLLLLLLVAFAWIFWLLAGLDEYEDLRALGHGGLNFLEERIWFAIVPLAAVAARWSRFGADRLLALRSSRIKPWLPLLMAVSLFGMAVWFHATGMVSVPPEFEAEHRYDILNWLAVVLAGAVTWLWLPLFPRITATLAGMCAALALIAFVVHPLFGSCWATYDPTSEAPSQAILLIVLFVCPAATFIWGAVSLWLWSWARTGIETDHPLYLLHFSVWSGAITLVVALIGTLAFTNCWT